MQYRVVDNKHLDGYPPGQIEVVVFTKDAASLSDWVTKHSRGTAVDPGLYYTQVTNQAVVNVGSREGLSFDWMPVTTNHITHAVAIFYGADYVLVMSWWSAVSYNLRDYHQQMLTSLT